MDGLTSASTYRLHITKTPQRIKPKKEHSINETNLYFLLTGCQDWPVLTALFRSKPSVPFKIYAFFIEQIAIYAAFFGDF